MAEQIAVLLTVEDVDGYIVPNKTPTTVELWVHGGSKVKDLVSGIVNNGDGTYSIDPSGLVYSALYDLKVDGVIEDEWKEFRLPTPDLLYSTLLDDVTIGLVGGKVAVLDDGIGKTKIAADVAGPGMVQNEDGSLSPKPDDITTEIVANKFVVKDGVFASGDEMDDAEAAIAAVVAIVGDGVFGNDKIIAPLGSKDLTNVILALSQEIWSLIVSGGSGGGSGGGVRTLYSDYTQDLSPSETIAMPIYVIDMATSSYKDLLVLPYYKKPGETLMMMSFAMCSQGNPPSASTIVKLNVGGESETIELSSENYNSVYGVYSIQVEVAGLALSTMHTIRVQGLNGAAEDQSYVKGLEINAS